MVWKHCVFPGDRKDSLYMYTYLSVDIALMCRSLISCDTGRCISIGKSTFSLGDILWLYK